MSNIECKSKELCREVHFKDNVHQRTVTVTRTVYTRKDGSQYVEHMRKRLEVKREFDFPTYEIHSRTIKLQSFDDVIAAVSARAKTDESAVDAVLNMHTKPTERMERLEETVAEDERREDAVCKVCGGPLKWMAGDLWTHDNSSGWYAGKQMDHDAELDFAQDEQLHPSCPQCTEGIGQPLGQLGHTKHFRCRACGSNFSTGPKTR